MLTLVSLFCHLHSVVFICDVIIAVGSYKHALDGLYRVFRDEGAIKLMNGATMASSRATLVTIGQVHTPLRLRYY